MADGARLSSAVMFVADLDRSVSFYTGVLALEVADRSQTAALLISGGGSQLILRAIGGYGNHALGGVGFQYVVWTASGRDELDRCERALKSRSAHRSTRTSGAVTAVEGRDPDDVAVVITYPGPDEAPPDTIPTRVYGW